MSESKHSGWQSEKQQQWNKGPKSSGWPWKITPTHSGWHTSPEQKTQREIPWITEEMKHWKERSKGPEWKKLGSPGWCGYRKPWTPDSLNPLPGFNALSVDKDNAHTNNSMQNMKE